MKITLEKEYKKFVTLEEAPLVRRFLANMKEDDFPIMDAAKMAIVTVVNGTRQKSAIPKREPSSGLAVYVCICRKLCVYGK